MSVLPSAFKFYPELASCLKQPEKHTEFLIGPYRFFIQPFRQVLKVDLVPKENSSLLEKFTSLEKRFNELCGILETKQTEELQSKALISHIVEMQPTISCVDDCQLD